MTTAPPRDPGLPAGDVGWGRAGVWDEPTEAPVCGLGEWELALPWGVCAGDDDVDFWSHQAESWSTTLPATAGTVTSDTGTTGTVTTGTVSAELTETACGIDPNGHYQAHPIALGGDGTVAAESAAPAVPPAPTGSAETADPVVAGSVAAATAQSVAATDSATKGSVAAAVAAGSAAPAGSAAAGVALSVGEQLAGALEGATAVLMAIPRQLEAVFSFDLAELTARACAVVAAAEAAQAAIVLAAEARGVIASSDNPRVDKYVEQACRDANVPVSTRRAALLKNVALSCHGHDVTALRDAVTTGRVSIETAELVATTFRKMRAKIGPGHWDPIVEALIDYAAAGARPGDMNDLAEAMVVQYTDPDTLDDERDQHSVNRHMSTFRKTRDGLYSATIRLDPAAKAIVEAALNALAAPTPHDHHASDTANGAGTPSGKNVHGADGFGDGAAVPLDLRTPGQRRADALTDLARAATRHDPDLPGSGAAAKVIITIDYDTLRHRLHHHGINPLTGHHHSCNLHAGSNAFGADDVANDTGSTHAGAHGVPGSGSGYTGNDVPNGGNARSTGGVSGSGALGSASGHTRNGVPNGDNARSNGNGVSGGGALGSGSGGTGSSGYTGSAVPRCTCGANGRGYGITEHGQILTPTEVRQLACNAGIIPVVLGSRGEILDVGREQRLATPGQRAALIVRDRGCTFPGCTAPPSWCQAHHTTPWELGGHTNLRELTLLCGHHHRETHAKGHIPTVTDTGVTWTRADRTPIGNTPRPGRCR